MKEKENIGRTFSSSPQFSEGLKHTVDAIADQFVNDLITITEDPEAREEAERLNKEITLITPEQLLKKFTI